MIWRCYNQRIDQNYFRKGNLIVGTLKLAAFLHFSV